MPEQRGVQNNGRGANAGVIINNLGKTSYILLAVLAGFGVASGVWALIDSSRAERETRMLEYYVMELDGKLMNAGAIDSTQSWAAQKRKREEQQK